MATATKTPEKKVEKKKRAKKPAPDLNKVAGSLTQPAAKKQFGDAVHAAEAIVVAFRDAGNVPTKDLRSVRRVLNDTLGQFLRSRHGGPKARKRARLVARIEETQAQLKQLEA